MSSLRLDVRHLILICALLIMTGAASAFQLGEGVAVPVDGRYMCAKWSPDGSGLALAGERYTGLYYADTMGGFSTISDRASAGWGFSWSPDGRSLAYRVREDDGMGMALFVAGRGQEGSQQITPYLNDMFPPKWGKDGVTYRSGDELVTVDETGKVKKVFSLSQGRGVLSRMMSVAGSFVLGRMIGATFTGFACGLASQSAEGKPGKGVFIDSESQIWIVDENGNKRKLIDVEGEVGYATPAESPQGDKYAVHGYSGDLYIQDARGGDPTNLGKGSSPTWSPDGKYVMFELTADDGHIITSSELWLASVDGSQRYQLTSGSLMAMSPSWSPDGKYVAYVIDGKVYVAPVE